MRSKHGLEVKVLVREKDVTDGVTANRASIRSQTGHYSLLLVNNSKMTVMAVCVVDGIVPKDGSEWSEQESSGYELPVGKSKKILGWKIGGILRLFSFFADDVEQKCPHWKPGKIEVRFYEVTDLGCEPEPLHVAEINYSVEPVTVTA